VGRRRVRQRSRRLRARGRPLQRPPAARPRTETALAALCANVARAQAALSVPLALENIAALFDWPDPTMDEPEFLGRLTAATGAGLIVDVSNLHAAARNLGVDARAWLARVPSSGSPTRTSEAVWPAAICGTTHTRTRCPGEALALLRRAGGANRVAGAMLERDDRFPRRGGESTASSTRSPRRCGRSTEQTRRGEKAGDRRQVGERARRHRAPVPSFLLRRPASTRSRWRRHRRGWSARSSPASPAPPDSTPPAWPSNRRCCARAASASPPRPRSMIEF
jgi:hypothetical protein